MGIINVYKVSDIISLSITYLENGTPITGLANKLSLNIMLNNSIILQNQLMVESTTSGLYTYDWDTTGLNYGVYLITYFYTDEYNQKLLIGTEQYDISKNLLDTSDFVWDEVLTGSTHNISSSAGRRLRQITSPIILEGFVISSTDNTVTFDGEASTVSGSYDPSIISIISGTGAGQSRVILEYKGDIKTAVVDRNWRINPDTTSEYIIVSSEGREHVNEGLAQGAGSGLNTLILNSNASPFDNAYIGQTLFLRSGKGEDQACKVIAYNGETKEATVDKDWWEVPDNTTGYVMLPTGVLDTKTIEDAVWNASKEDHTISNTMGSELQTLMDIQVGNWKIDGTIMIFYSQTGEELYRYSLLDSTGLPTNKDVFQRVKL